MLPTDPVDPSSHPQVAPRAPRRLTSLAPSQVRTTSRTWSMLLSLPPTLHAMTIRWFPCRQGCGCHRGTSLSVGVMDSSTCRLVSAGDSPQTFFFCVFWKLGVLLVLWYTFEKKTPPWLHTKTKTNILAQGQILFCIHEATMVTNPINNPINCNISLSLCTRTKWSGAKPS